MSAPARTPRGYDVVPEFLREQILDALAVPGGAR